MNRGEDILHREAGEESAPIYAALRDIFASVFGRDDIVLTPELTAKDVAGWDSFKQIEIIIAAEQRFGFKFASAEIDRMQTLGDLVAIVAARRQRSEHHHPGALGDA